MAQSSGIRGNIFLSGTTVIVFVCLQTFVDCSPTKPQFVNKSGLNRQMNSMSPVTPSRLQGEGTEHNPIRALSNITSTIAALHRGGIQRIKRTQAAKGRRNKTDAMAPEMMKKTKGNGNLNLH